ncbi:wax ester/triacylglycerol synthase domain-containing protein [Spirillospora sp. NPDC127200]
MPPEIPTTGGNLPDPAALSDLGSWGTHPFLNGLETAFLRMDSDSTARLGGTIVWTLDRAPEWDRFVACCEQTVGRLPRLRLRVVDPPLGLGWPVWECDPHFDLGYHVGRTRLPGPAGRRELLDFAERVQASAFDRERPLWRVHLVEGEDRGNAVVIKMHHAVTDGVGINQAMSSLLPDSAAASGPLPGAPVSPEHVGAVRLLAVAAATNVGSLPLATGRRALRLAGRLPKATRSPSKALGTLDELLRTVEQVLLAAGGSPLLSGRGPGLRFDAHEVPTASLKAAAKRADASITAVHLAVLLGAYSDYHRRQGVSHDVLSMSVPVDVRSQHTFTGNNSIGVMTVAGSLAEMEPVPRIQAMYRMLQRGRLGPLAQAAPALTELIPLVPPMLVRALARRVTARVDLLASSIRGMRRPGYVAGAKITSHLLFGPRAGLGTISALMSHDDAFGLTLHMDPASVTDTELFGELVRKNLHDLLATGGRPPAVGRRTAR